MIELIKIQASNRELFWNIHQKYLYEMTNYYDDIMDDKGNYQYGYFDDYFTDPKREAYFIYYNKNIVGFVMINPYSYLDQNPDYVLAEFTVFPVYRKQHIATNVVEMIFKQYLGSWEIKYNENNIPAKRFWNKVCTKYNPLKKSLNQFETVLLFSTK